MAKPRRFVVATDNHGDMCDTRTTSALMDFCRDFKPEVRVHLGDNWDFRNLRRGASDDEKAHSLQDDWEAGVDFARSFFEGGKENHFLWGNHDWRLHQLAESATGVLRDYAEDGIKRVNATLKRCRAATLPYDSAFGILKLGHLSALHGYFAGERACQQHANVYGNCVFGHVHSDQVAPVPSLTPSEARSIPCLCKRDMTYINAKTAKLRWARGWAYGYLLDHGMYQLFVTKEINGSYYAAQTIATY